MNCVLVAALVLAGVAGAPTAAAYTPTAALPTLLAFENGSAVTTPAQWQARRSELKELLQTHITGALPPTPPALLSAHIVNSTQAGGLTLETVQLTFDTPLSPTGFFIRLFVPNITTTTATHNNTNKLPVFLTQWNHAAWARRAASRGYLACIYPGADTRDAGDRFAAQYPQASWRKIIRRAWIASRTLDYLLGPQRSDADATRVSITGHSRNGKQSLLAAAFDERITAVVGSSPGVPIASPFRFASKQFAGETVHDISPERGWWLPSLIPYFGREHELPVDGNAVLGLVAPRLLVLATAHNDHESDISFANERSLRSARTVYALLGHPERAVIDYRPGDHHGFITVDRYLSWFDAAGGAGPAPTPEPELFTFDWAEWNRTAVFERTPPPRSAPLAARVEWLLGARLQIGASPGATYSEENYEWTYISAMLGHDNYREAGDCSQRMAASFGAYQVVNVYYPCNISAGQGDLPVLIYLHPHSYQCGFVPDYDAEDAGQPRTGAVYQHLAAAGYFVIVYDQVGCGLRLPENRDFYARYPDSSKFAHMVGEVSAAVDFAYCRSAQGRRDAGTCGDGEAHTPTYPDKLGELPSVDMAKVFVAGYSIGGAVALHAAAADPRIAGVAVFAGFTPMRGDANSGPTGGIQRLYDWHALLPRLGLFQHALADIPYDYDELIASLAPRPVLLYTPGGDRDADAGQVAACVAAARKAWVAAGASDKFTLVAPANVTSVFTNTQILVLEQWLGMYR